jgi:hypothetical protein
MWRLVVTPLSGTTSLHQLEVEAPNWMGALRAARKEMGEDGGLPAGASCAVAPDGTVTILDSASRRKFLLTPGSVEAKPIASSTSSGKTRPITAPEPKRAKPFDTIGYGSVSGVVPAPARAVTASDPARASLPPEAPKELEVLITRDEEPSADNPLAYRERAYFIPRGVSVSDAEVALRFTLAELQLKLAPIPRGKFVNLAAFDHRWTDQPQRPPLIVLEWRDWRGDPIVDYPANEASGGGLASRINAEPDDRLASVFESLHELAHLTTPADGLEFIVQLLDNTVSATALAGCLYDINTDELRFVALTGPAADELKGTAIPRNQGLFGRAARLEHGALLIRNIAEEPEYDRGSDGRLGLEAENMLLRPLVHDGRLLGMLQLINRTTGSFSAPDLHLVNYAADRLSEFLRDARDRVHP